MIDAAPKAVAAKTGRRFVTLDALRGVGAASVMAGHAGPLLGGYAPPLTYLAVDMFFVLSGFVISHAYDQKMAAGMRPLEFLRARVKRLYPIYFVGLLLGLVSVFFVNPHQLSLVQTALTFICGLFALPTPPMGPLKALFPLNGPYWSLFFEFWVANVSFAFLWPRLQGKALLAFIGFCGLVLLVGVLYTRRLDLGWNWHSGLGGLARVCFSFYVGVFLARLHASHPPKIEIPSAACLFAFCAVMALPVDAHWSAMVGLVVIFLFFPALIFWGAEAVESHPAVGKAIGDASYALYAIHRPILYILVGLLAAGNLPAVAKPYSLAAEALFMIFVGVLAWAINKLLSPSKKTFVASERAST